VYSEKGGKDGTIIVSGKRDCGDVFLGFSHFLLNDKLAKGSWQKTPMLMEYDNRILQTGWSKGMALIDNGTKLIQLSPVQSTNALMHIAYAIADIIEE